MTEKSLDQARARELLAAAYDRLGATGSARRLRADPESDMVQEEAAMEVIAALSQSAPTSAAVERAAREAIILIDEINERRASRDFNGIGTALHAKICTIRVTLARALNPASSSNEGEGP